MRRQRSPGSQLPAGRWQRWRWRWRPVRNPLLQLQQARPHSTRVYCQIDPCHAAATGKEYLFTSDADGGELLFSSDLRVARTGRGAVTFPMLTNDDDGCFDAVLMLMPCFWSLGLYRAVQKKSGPNAS